MRPNIRLVGDQVLLMQAERRIALTQCALKANRGQDTLVEIVVWLIVMGAGLWLIWR